MRASPKIIIAVLGIVWGAAPGAGDSRSSLKLLMEVRHRVHDHYVDRVDSLTVIAGAIDGLMAALPQGENLYISPAEMAEVGYAAAPPELGNRQQLELLTEAFRQVHRQYVSQVSTDTLSRAAVRGMLSALDPHSAYLDPRDYEQMKERFRGDFEGIGIHFEIRQGELLVISPIVGSPSDGILRAGDRIAAIDGVSTEGITAEQVMKKLRGPKGSQVRVGVERSGAGELVEFAIVRDRIPVRSVPHAFMLEPRTGYVRITRFAENTGPELGEALDSLRVQGAQRLLLDLRANGGGLLAQAVEVADYFVERGELIVYTEGRDATRRREFRALRPLRGRPLSLIVMLDHGSASASEIVAGAVQDLDLGLVVGQTSFGKGLVQEQYPLLSGRGGLLLLTVGRYYTPLGRLIQRPYTQDLQAYVQEGWDDLDPNAVDSLRAQKRVFYTALGRPVYGGGGITPDRRLDPEPITEPMHRILGSGALADFSVNWVGSRAAWPEAFGDFAASYRVPDAALEALRSFLAGAGIALDEEVFAAHGAVLRRALKADIARVLWGAEASYRIHLEGDRQVSQAVALFGEADGLMDERLKRTGDSQ